MKTREDIRKFFLEQTPENPMFATVSGVVSTTADMIRYTHNHLDAIGVITTKSIQVKPNPGNREPIIVENSAGCYGNSVGLRNKGMEVSLAEFTKLREEIDFTKILNISLSGSSPQEFVTLVQAFESVGDMFELNFSCPHAAAGYGSSIGSSAEVVAEYVREIRKVTDAPIFPKLTPNVDNIGEIAAAAVEAGADGIVAINTVGPVEHREPLSGAVVLNNKLGGKGGKSGRSVFRQATHSIREIREAIGANVPILGMGGVVSAKEAASLIKAGANIVGVGSGFGMVHQENWNDWLISMQQGTRSLLHGEVVDKNAYLFLNMDRQMEYRPVTITDVQTYQPGVKVFITDKHEPCKPGEFFFIWVPGLGEKPFSAAGTTPLKFLIKERGEFTEGMMSKEVGDTLYIRGPYGRDAKFSPNRSAVLVGGGTGVAVLPLVAKDLYQKRCSKITIFCGVPSGNKPLLAEELTPYGEYHVIGDDGQIGRVIQEAAYAITDPRMTDLYIVGPEAFMVKMAEEGIARGVSSERIYISLEESTRCGVGICGECSCHGKLTCQCGTFTTYKEYTEGL